MSQRTTAGHPADNPRMSETVSTPCPSEGSKAVRQADSKADNNTHSSRSDALPRGREIETTHLSRLADIHPIDGLAKVVLTLRPDWTAKAVINWISNDDRPWVEVCRSALRADDRDIRQPAGLRYVGADYDGKPTPLPPTVRELRTAPTCQHGAASGLCALCRAGLE